MASLDDIFLRLDGAEADLETVDSEANGFLDRNPYRIVRQDKPYEFKHLFRAYVYEEPPASLRRAVGYVLQDLRNCLDNLVYQLAILETGKDPPPDEDGIAFPIFVQSGAFRKKTKRALKNIGPGPLREIIDVQPFKRAKEVDPLWILHRLAQDDKHKRPVILGSAVSGSSLYIKHMSGMHGFRDSTHYGPFEDNAVVAEVYARPGPDAHLDMEFTLVSDVAFPKEGPAQGRPVREVLAQLVSHVRVEVLPRFEQFF